MVRWVDFSIGRPLVLGLPIIPSPAFGVGKRCVPRTSGRVPFPASTCALAAGAVMEPWASIARGVGNETTWFPSPAGWCFMLLPVFGASGIVSGVENTGPCDEEYSCAVVGCADVGRS